MNSDDAIIRRCSMCCNAFLKGIYANGSVAAAKLGRLVLSQFWTHCIPMRLFTLEFASSIQFSSCAVNKPLPTVMIVCAIGMSCVVFVFDRRRHLSNFCENYVSVESPTLARCQRWSVEISKVLWVSGKDLWWRHQCRAIIIRPHRTHRVQRCGLLLKMSFCLVVGHNHEMSSSVATSCFLHFHSPDGGTRLAECRWSMLREAATLPAPVLGTAAPLTIRCCQSTSKTSGDGAYNLIVSKQRRQSYSICGIFNSFADGQETIRKIPNSHVSTRPGRQKMFGRVGSSDVNWA